MLILIIVFVSLFAIYACLMLVYKIGWHLPINKPAPDFTPGNKVSSLSIIIPARNEAENICTCIKSILNNKEVAIPFEILLIDDFSEDGTAAIGTQLLNATGKGRVIRLSNYLSSQERINSYKKKALEIAIGEATGDWIITTDADCIVPEFWIKNLLQSIQIPDIKFVAAPVSFTPAHETKDWLYYFQSLDFMTMQGITAACARLNLGNMCNGANLAFEKKAFYEVGGYKGIDEIASGDDMLLMYRIRAKYPQGIYYLKSEQAIVATPVQPDWDSFINQRIRWSSKADKYDDKKLTIMLTFVYLFNLSLPVVGVSCLIAGKYGFLFIGIMLAKIVLELFFLQPVAKFYNKSKELWAFPLLQPPHIIYIIMAGFLGKFGSYKWKGRKVK